jgi:hypothetical protein
MVWCRRSAQCLFLVLQASKVPRRLRKTAKGSEAAAAAADAGKQQVVRQMSRDQHLSAYHAIGKILHYKRPLQPPPEAAQHQQAASQAAADVALDPEPWSGNLNPPCTDTRRSGGRGGGGGATTAAGQAVMLDGH